MREHRLGFTCLKVLKKRSWNWITKEVRLPVEEKKQTSRILRVQDKATITTGSSTSTHSRSTNAQNTVSEAHDSAFRALASVSLSEFCAVRLCLCVSVCSNLTAPCQTSWSLQRSNQNSRWWARRRRLIGHTLSVAKSLTWWTRITMGTRKTTMRLSPFKRRLWARDFTRNTATSVLPPPVPRFRIIFSCEVFSKTSSWYLRSDAT